MTWLRTVASRVVVALVFSFGLWVFVSFSENPDRSTSFEGLPVAVEGLAPGLVIVDPNGLPRQDQENLSPVDVEVTTDQASLSQLRPQDLRAFVNLGDLSPGDHQVPVQVEALVSYLRAGDFETSPENLSVRLEERITRTVPITIEVQGSLPFSFERGDPEVSLNGQAVESVAATGPRSRVERVVGAFAVADINQLRGNYISALDLIPRDANDDPLEGVTIEPPSVRVSIPIRSVVGLKRVPVLGQLDGSPAPGYVVAGIESEPSLVNISGRSVVLDAIEFAETVPIDVTGATRVVTERVALLLPPGVSPDLEPAEVVVQVNVERLTRPFEVLLPFPVTVRGAADGVTVTTEPGVISVAVEGTTDVWSQLDSTTLEATVDVSGFRDGPHSLQPEITLPEGVRLVGEIPSVDVTLLPPPTATPIPTNSPTPTEQTVPTTTTETATEAPDVTVENETETPADSSAEEGSATEEPFIIPTAPTPDATPAPEASPSGSSDLAFPTEEVLPPEEITIERSPAPFSGEGFETTVVPSATPGS